MAAIASVPRRRDSRVIIILNYFNGVANQGLILPDIASSDRDVAYPERICVVGSQRLSLEAVSHTGNLGMRRC